MATPGSPVLDTSGPGRRALGSRRLPIITSGWSCRISFATSRAFLRFQDASQLPSNQMQPTGPYCVSSSCIWGLKVFST